MFIFVAVHYLDLNAKKTLKKCHFLELCFFLKLSTWSNELQILLVNNNKINKDPFSSASLRLHTDFCRQERGKEKIKGKLHGSHCGSSPVPLNLHMSAPSQQRRRAVHTIDCL